MSIATSTIQIYKNVKLDINKNFIIDDIENYLAWNHTVDKIVLNNFQYIKVSELDITIKVNLPQQTLMSSYNYVSIKNSDNDRKFYYFIVDRKWRGENTWQLSLHMDVLNSFKLNDNYILTNKTIVTREHKDRWIDLLNGHYEQQYNNLTIPEVGYINVVMTGADAITAYLRNQSFGGGHLSFSTDDQDILASFDGLSVVPYGIKVKLRSLYDEEQTFGQLNVYMHINQARLFRIVDLPSEDIDVIKYKRSEEVINDPSNKTWLLHYVNTNDITPTNYQEVNPVECHLIPKDSGVFNIPASSSLISTANTDDDKSYYFSPDMSGNLKFQINSKSFELYIVNEGLYIGFYGVMIARSGNSFTLYYYYVVPRVLSTSFTLIATETASSIAVINAPASISCHREDGTTLLDGASISNMSTNASISGSGSSNETVAGEQSIDRTNQRNIKIIELPYCPTPVKNVSDIYFLSSEWVYNSAGGYFALGNLNTKFEHEFDSNVDNPFRKALLDYPHKTPSEARDIINESKLFHSDFYSYKFVYDSFSMTYMNELIDIYRVNLSEKFKIKFVTSRNIVSKFSFIFPQYILSHSISDYDNVVNVARNNEQVLYTSSYINYLKNGYNYDVKSKERQETAGAIGLGLSAAGMVASIAVGAITANPVIAVGGAVASGISFASQMVNHVKSVSESEQSIARKLQESKNQAVSVLNADDVDLLNAYCGNKAKLCLYSVSDRVKNALFDLFHYCGYKTYEQKIPNTNTRYWFNFVSAKIDVSYFIDGMTADIKEELINKWNDGVTFFHKRDNAWNVDQDKENIENSIWFS